ncbi:hypothetical protein [Actinomycetospora sp. CA-084318]|uniref:hypothetical protein n=1 Tax=Actinomycetospora sp. CA-084318 TaxID=3239892 RepID=UPI003D95CD1E
MTDTLLLRPGTASEPALALDDVERVWRAAGLLGRCAAVEVPTDTGRTGLGLVTASTSVATVESVRKLAVPEALRPAVVQVGGLPASRPTLARALTTGRRTDGPDPLRCLAERIAVRFPVPAVRVDLRLGDDPVHAARDGLVVVLHGPGHDRWDAVHAVLGLGAAVAGSALARDGAGGVVWGRYPAGTRRSDHPAPVTAST